MYEVNHNMKPINSEYCNKQSYTISSPDKLGSVIFHLGVFMPCKHSYVL